MSILQRYILRELAGPIILSILFFSFLMMLRQLFKFAELLLEAGVSFDILLEFLGIIMLTLIIITIPMAALLGSLIGIGRLTGENEILAMRVGGVSLPRIFMPVFVFALLGSVALMWCGFNLLPNMINRLTQKQERIQFEIITNLDPGRLYELETDEADISLFYEERLPRERGDTPFTLRMHQVALRLEGDAEELVGAELATGPASVTDPETGVERREQNESLIFAEDGVIQGDLDTRTVSLSLSNGIVFPVKTIIESRPEGEKAYYREDMEEESSLTFKSLLRTLKPKSEYEGADQLDPRQMTLGKLREITSAEPGTSMLKDNGDLRKEWRFYLSARNELFQRFTLPWSLLAFVLIAVPLAVELRPRAKSFAFIMALVLILLYYVMLTTAGAIGMTYSPFTFLAYLSPNLLIGGIGIYLFWKVQR